MEGMLIKGTQFSSEIAIPEASLPLPFEQRRPRSSSPTEAIQGEKRRCPGGQAPHGQHETTTKERR